MANVQESNTWEAGIYQLEETDLVLAGPDGIANQQAKQLANRTLWLRNAMRGFNAFTFLSSSVSLTKEDVLQKLVVVNANNASLAYSLPDLPGADAGLRVSIMAYNVSRQVTVGSSSQNIIMSSVLKRWLYLGDGDMIDLVWTGDHWLLLDFKGNFVEVGLPVFSYSELPNTKVANGQLLNRSDFPRLWEYANSLVGSLVSDISWNNTAGSKGFFSTGNGTTTFRIPDLRSMFIRGLDLGAGISYGRNSFNPGGYEADEFKSHTHNVTPDDRKGRSDNANDRDVMLPNGDGRFITTSASGGTETRPKNIGLIPLIKI